MTQRDGVYLFGCMLPHPLPKHPWFYTRVHWAPHVFVLYFLTAPSGRLNGVISFLGFVLFVPS